MHHLDTFLVLDTAAQVKALAQPDRLAMLRLLREEPASITMIAARLDIPPNRAHYHLQQLLEHGLVREVGTGRKRWKSEERFYLASAQHFLVDPSLGCWDADATAALRRAAELIFFDWRRREVLEVDLGAVAARAVRHGVGVRPGDHVLVMYGPYALQMAEALVVEIRAAGGHPIESIWSRGLHERLMERMSLEDLAACPIVDPAQDARLASVIFAASGMPQGPPPTEAQRRMLAPILENMSRWKRSLRARGVRNLQLSLPHRGEFFPVTPGCPEPTDAYWGALQVPHEVLQRRGELLAAAVAGATSAHLTGPHGGDLRIELDPQIVHVSDGVISDRDVAAGQVFDELPAGSLVVLPRPGGADGTFHADYAFARGQHFRDLTITLERGRITGLAGPKEVDLLGDHLRAMAGDGDLISAVQIGLNPGCGGGVTGKPNLDMAAEGVVGLVFGNNEILGGKVSATFTLMVPARGATLTVGRTEVVRDGVLGAEFVG
ncbi:MAG TPA: helix-turn-helix domain-containing protein [Phycisphaerales bacterium]|nr:helix-turn-helix domain-containing protein [Phycisphaerales bacterium]